MQTWHGPRFWWQSLRLPVTLIACAILAWTVHVRERGERWRPSDPSPWVRDLPETERVYRGVDVARVHAVLLPQFWLSQQRIDRRVRYRDPVFAALYEELRPVPAWAALALAWRTALEQPVQDEAEIRRIERAWNDAMREAGLPWSVRTPLDADVRRLGHIALSYYVESDSDVPTEIGPLRVVYGRRVDRLNLREGYFGWSNAQTGEAFVALDRVEAFARAELWPLMSDDAARVDPRLSDAMRVALREELLGVLPAPSHAPLVATAPARARQLRVVQSLIGRPGCDASLPADELVERRWDRAAIRTLQSQLEPVSDDCASSDGFEVRRLQSAERRIAMVPGVEPAVQELTYAAASAVAAHEVQHLLDDALGTLRGASDVDYEVSAYLGSIARSQVPHVSLLMACRVAQSGPWELANGVGAALRAVDPMGCAGAPPQEVHVRASLARDALIDASQSISLR